MRASGRDRILPASTLREDVAHVLLHGRIARHLLRGGREVFFRLVVVATAVIGPAEAVEIIRVVRLDVERLANQPNRFIELLAAVGEQVAEVVQSIRVARLERDELSDRPLRVSLSPRVAIEIRQRQLRRRVVRVRLRDRLEDGDRAARIAQLQQRVRAQLREAQIVRVLRLRLTREISGALKILRADQRRDAAHFQLAAVRRDRQRFRVRVRRILQAPGLLLELAEHVRDARLVVDDLLRAPRWRC